MCFITDTDLATFLGQPSLVGDPRAVMVTAMASAIISDYLQNPGLIQTTVYTDAVFDGPARGSSVFLLPGFPIQSVAKIETRLGETWTVLDPTRYRWNAAGFISRTLIADGVRPGCWWPEEIKSIRVTYTAGYVSIPLTVKAITLGIAARGFVNPVGLLSEQIGDYQYSSGAAHASWLELDKNELAILSAYSDWPVG